MVTLNKHKISRQNASVWADDGGATSLQYGLIAGFIGLAIVAGASAVGYEADQTLGHTAKVLTLGHDGNLIDEDGVFTREDAGTILLDRGTWVRTDALEGWELGGVGIAEIKEPGYNNMVAPGDWGGYVDMAGSPGGLDLERTLNTVAGQTYTVSFDAANPTRLGNVEVWVGGELLGSASGGTATNSREFTNHSFTFTASGADELVIKEAGNVTNVGTAIANIHIG